VRQILRSLVIPFNIVTSFIVLGMLPGRSTILCCGVVMAGFTLGSFSELNFTWEGFASGCLASLFMALYSTFVKAVDPISSFPHTESAPISWPIGHRIAATLSALWWHGN